MPAPLKTFIIYSSADRELRSALERQLKSLIDNGLIRLWSDKEILPGEMWDSAIKKQLLEADLFLMLISADFFNSDYIREEEFVTALQKLERGEAIIIPIIGRDCDWEAYAEIKKLQVLPPGGVAVTDLDHWKSTDKAWAEVTRAIRRRIEALHTEQTKREKTAPRNRPKDPYPGNKTSEKAPNWLRTGMFTAGGLLAMWLIWFMFFRESAIGTSTISQSLTDAQGAQTAETPLQKDPASEKIKSGLEMVRVEGGTFTMGSNEEDDEKPPHRVTLSTFLIGKYEVTQADWFDIMGNRPSAQKNCDECPVEQVSWDDIQAFFKKLNAKYPGRKYRLPTEAEWEFAARGGTLSQGFRYAGGNDIDEVAWYGENSGKETHRVGGKKANELGLHDMSGNVWEWCSDWYGDYPAGAQTNPAGPASGSIRVFRGGSAWGGAVDCRPARRTGRTPTFRYVALGFRLVSVSLQ